MEYEYELNFAVIQSHLEGSGRGGIERLCGKVGASRFWLEHMRRGRRLPNGNKLAALADALDIPVETLIVRKRRRSV